VPLTVRYKLDGKGKSLAKSSLTTRLSAAAKLPGGRVLRGVEKRRVPGKASVRIEHHLFFSVRETKILRKALAAEQPVKLAVASSLQADLDGDGTTDARTTQKSSQVLSAPTAAKSPAPLKHQQGNDPCGVLGLTSAACQNVTGSPFTATHLWDSGQLLIVCGLAYPYATNSVSTQTTSKLYTQTTSVAGSRDHATRINIIDDNVRGHPYTYTPTAACTTTNTQG
jgi:hypothetical protein